MSRSQTIDSVLLETETMDSFIRSFMSSLIVTTRTSSSLTTDSSSPLFSQSQHANTVRGIIQKVTGFCSSEPVLLSDDLTSEPENSTLYEQILTVIESLLESAEDDFDDIQGFKERVKQSLYLDKEKIFMSSSSENIIKPQLKFMHEICNSRGVAFRPRITTKFYAKIPYDFKELKTKTDTVEEAALPATYFVHPYETELRQLQYLPSQLSNDTTLHVPAILTISQRGMKYIDTEPDFARLLQDLRLQREIAVDLEHHSHRSFQGFTCLMQISTRNNIDYLIDTLALRSSMHQLLEVFANPDIVKIFHGADSDILWLQRDFGIYVVNCFDTFQAAKLLQYPALSLAHLVKFHCGVTLNKKYQLADWRQRPLSTEMQAYARLDTVYLLTIYDLMRHEIFVSHGEEGLMTVLDASKLTCLKRYEIEGFYPNRYKRILENSRFTYKNAKISSTQDLIMAALFDWRDLKARELDESVLFVMSNSELYRLGTAVPRSVQELDKCAPLGATTLLYKEEIISLINDKLSLPTARSSAPSAVHSRRDILSSPYFQPVEHSSVLSFTPLPPKPAHEALLRLEARVSPKPSPVLSTQDVQTLMI